jgi:hypothetical protein
MSTFVLANSELLKLVSAHVQRAPSRRRTLGPRTIFLPWFAFSHEESKQKLEEFTRHLQLPLLILPAHYSVTHDARLLKALAQQLCESNLRDTLEQALQQLPYSMQLEDAVRVCMRNELQQRQRKLAIAALNSGVEAESSVSRMLNWAAQIGLESVLVFAHKRPPGLVEIVDLPIRRLRTDVLKLIPPLPEAPVDDGNGWPHEESARPPRSSFYARLLRFLQRATEDRPEFEPTQDLQPDARSPLQPAPANDDDDADTVADWADLLVRLSAANWGIVEAIASAWQGLETLVDTHFRELRKETRLNPDNVEERETLELRLRFVVMLRVLYPEAFNAAADELDGADQLYRVLLILCGQTASDSLVASNLLPFWRQQLDDPLFCELCYACFNEIGRDRSLVPRVQSRAQLHRLLSLVNRRSAGEAGSQDDLDDLFKQHRAWIRQLSAGYISYEPIRCMVQAARGMLRRTYPSATQALQAAQALMSAYELLPSTEVPVDRNDLFSGIERLSRRAINQSRGAIRFDAALLRARALAVKGDFDAAIDVLRIMRRTVDEPLSRCAVDVEEAFVHERAKDLFAAARLYEKTLGHAEQMGADELVARSASGCLRCDAAGYEANPDRLIQVRARIIVEIQSARAPELFPMSERSKPRLFLSYRSETRAITEHLLVAYPQDDSRKDSHLYAWADVRLAEKQDFDPRIHQLLHDSDAIVLLLSPNYFDSAWCVHELHFALGQSEIRGIPLYWAWCSNAVAAGVACEAAARSELMAYVERSNAQQASGDGPLGRPGARLSHRQAHLNDRLDRLFTRGRLLANAPLPYSNSHVAARSAGTLISALKGTVHYLYSRAKLPPPHEPDEPEPRTPRLPSRPRTPPPSPGVSP